MLDNCGMTPLTYEMTLDGWSKNDSTPDEIILGSEELTYCREESRNILIH